ncbi:MAG: GH92 family glycosyl hydrolase [Pseudomonadota bacterium]
MPLDIASVAPLHEVDPFIGVDGPGAVLCGPYTPLALVRLGPDTVPPHRTNGYRSDFPLLGFSHTHVSGTGGEGRFGNVRLIPFCGRELPDMQGWERQEEQAQVGLYQVILGGVNVALTSAPRCGITRLQYPPDTEAGLLIDAGAVHYHGSPNSASCIEASVRQTSPTTFEGQGTFKGGWGHHHPYQIFFAGEVSCGWDGCEVTADGRSLHLSWAARHGDFPVEIRIGVSFVGLAQARESLRSETQGHSFAQLVAAHQQAWLTWFERLQVEGGTPEQRRIFHTFFTRLLCMPTDLGVEDEFGHWPTKVRHFSEFYALWDSVRNANSLITLFAPELERDFLNCLLDVAEHRGWLPDAWITGHSTKVQGGSSADLLFNEAHLKGLEGIDYARALTFMAKNNSEEPDDPYQNGRYLADYRDLGYVSTRAINCVSRHLEYAYQDWATGSLARRLGDEALAEHSFTSAAKVWNLWHDGLAHFAPKDPDGNWARPFDINVARPDSWNDPYFYEGISRAWSFNTQHDFAGLVARCGGEAAFEARLDAYFADKLRATKETFMHIPLLYHYAGRPDKSSLMLRTILSKAYSTARNGLPDNEDMGCHSAMYICGLLGLYPMMGQDWYFLTAPAFTRAQIQLGSSGKTLVVSAPAAGPEHLYIGRAWFDGRELQDAWIRHEQLCDGGELVFELQTRPGGWGRASRPPSPLSAGI